MNLAQREYQDALDRINRSTDKEIDEAMRSADLTRAKIKAAFKADRTYPASIKDAKERKE